MRFQADGKGRTPHVNFLSRYFGCVEIHSAATAWPYIAQLISEPSKGTRSGRQASALACKQTKRVRAIISVLGCEVPRHFRNLTRLRVIPIPQKICFAGEVGLNGEIRAVNRIEQRIAEAEKLGFEKILVSKYNKICTKRAVV